MKTKGVGSVPDQDSGEYPLEDVCQTKDPLNWILATRVVVQPRQ